MGYMHDVCIHGILWIRIEGGMDGWMDGMDGMDGRMHTWGGFQGWMKGRKGEVGD